MSFWSFKRRDKVYNLMVMHWGKEKQRILKSKENRLGLTLAKRQASSEFYRELKEGVEKGMALSYKTDDSPRGSGSKRQRRYVYPVHIAFSFSIYLFIFRFCFSFFSFITDSCV